MKPVQTRDQDVDPRVFPGAMTVGFPLSGFQTNGSDAVSEDAVAPVLGPGRHIHHGQDQTFWFLEGSFDAEIGGVLHHMEPEDVGVLPRETVHATKTVGRTPGRFRHVFSPALRREETCRALQKARGDETL